MQLKNLNPNPNKLENRLARYSSELRKTKKSHRDLVRFGNVKQQGKFLLSCKSSIIALASVHAEDESAFLKLLVQSYKNIIAFI